MPRITHNPSPAGEQNASPKRAALVQTLACALALLQCAIATAATDVTFNLSPRETWVGSPSVMKIVVRDGDVIGEPILPKVTGVDFETQPGRQTMSSMQIVNGAVSRESTTVISVLITPSTVGIIQIPPITVDVDGVKYSITPTSISTVVSTTGDLLKAEVVAAEESAWVGQSITATLRILVKPFQSSQHQVTLGEGDMWQFIDQSRCDFGPFTKALAEMLQRRQRPLGREELIEGQAYIVYDIPATITMTSSGAPDFSEIRIAWNYPTRLAAERDFFGRNNLSVSSTKPISADADAANFDVLPLPTVGRPESFQGAIGSFAISASAKPASVAVGDPITLTLVVTDRSPNRPLALGALLPPSLAFPALEDGFRMPSAPLAGTVEGNTKTFTQTIRPTRMDIHEIPAIEFSWFDPTLGTYQSASTAPIGVTVVASERISTDAIIGRATEESAIEKSLTVAKGGLTANVSPTLAMVRDQSARIGLVAATIALIAPPFACAAVLLLRRRSDRLGNDGALVRQRGARASALKRLASGDEVAAIVGFIADQVSHPSATLTRSEARKFALAAGAPISLVERIDHLLARGDHARFSAQAGATGTESQLSEARECLQLLERLNWKAARTPDTRGDS